MTLGCFEFLSTFRKAGCAYWDLSNSAQLREQPGDSTRQHAAWLRTRRGGGGGIGEARDFKRDNNSFWTLALGWNTMLRIGFFSLFFSFFLPQLIVSVLDMISVASFRSYNLLCLVFYVMTVLQHSVLSHSGKSFSLHLKKPKPPRMVRTHRAD